MNERVWGWIWGGLAVASSLTVAAEERSANTLVDGARARMKAVRDTAHFERMVDDTAATYKDMVKGLHGAVPNSVLTAARCIAVLPRVLTGAFVVGGTHGEGLASCRNGEAGWSQPAPVALNQGSIGLQAGVKSADLVFFFMTKEAEEALKKGAFTVGADLSVVGGNFDAGSALSSAAVIVYARAEGVYAGASVNGSQFGKNQANLDSFYGSSTDFTALLDGRNAPDSAGYARKLTLLLP
jgi:SH3 domain-containing YSC84-like protein 1